MASGRIGASRSQQRTTRKPRAHRINVRVVVSSAPPLDAQAAPHAIRARAIKPRATDRGNAAEMVHVEIRENALAHVGGKVGK